MSNQKGGVGKTTTCVNLAACLAERGKKVLVIDMDAQGNATSGLGVARIEGDSLYDALLDLSDLRPYIKKTATENLDLIPSERDLAGVEIELPQMENYLSRLRTILHPLRDATDYDFIFLDCPPSFGILSMNALIATDTLIIPLQCEYYSLEGISGITDMIHQLRTSKSNPDLHVEGILMTMYDSRTLLARMVIKEVRDTFSDLLFDTMIPRTVRLSEAPSYGQPIIQYDSSSSGAMAYRKLAREFIRRQDNPPATEHITTLVDELEPEPAKPPPIVAQPEADVRPPEPDMMPEASTRNIQGRD